MKQRSAFLALSLAIATQAFGQTDSVRVWNKWCSRRDTLLLFNGGNNEIQVYCRSLKASDMMLKSLDHSLRIGNPEIKNDTITVMAMPYPAKGKRMRLAVMNKKSKKVITTLNFTSDNIPPLKAKVGKIESAEASKKDILAQTAVRAYFPGSLYSYPYTIKQYCFKIHTDKVTATINANGFFISKDVLQLINDAPAGTMLEFSNIKATCPECASRTVEDIKLKMK